MEDILLLVLFLVLSGFFSGAEIALFSLGAEKIQAQKNRVKSTKRLRRIQRLELLKAKPHSLLVTILIGNNVVNVASASLATLMAIRFSESVGFSGDTTTLVGVVTGVMTFLILFFGEITPKALANKYALNFALFSTPILGFLQILLSPIVIPLSKVVEAFSKSEIDQEGQGLSEEELKAAIELSQKDGKIEFEEKEMFEKVLEFDEHDVSSIMTPRSKIFFLEDASSIPEAISQMSQAKFSRVPVFHENRDNITGILTIHTIMEAVAEGGFENKNVANVSLIKPFKVPPTMRINSLMRELQEKTLHMALVYDEHGGLVGLITLEDIMEEIFGEIRDEQDEENKNIRRKGKHHFLCGAEIELEHIETFLQETLGKEAPHRFPWELEDENKALSYFLLEKLQRFPEKGEKIVIEETRSTKFTFKIEEVEQEKIVSVSFSIDVKKEHI